jgi:hypothetical protein
MKSFEAKALPSACAMFGMIADQATTSTATVFTYTGGRGCNQQPRAHAWVQAKTAAQQLAAQDVACLIVGDLRAGYGLSVNGTPMVQTPGSKTLVLSADPACTSAGGDALTFTPAGGRPWSREHPLVGASSLAVRDGRAILAAPFALSKPCSG